MKRKINNSNMLRRCLALFIVIMLATVVLCTTVSAASIQTVPYDNYTIWNGYDKKVTTSQRPVYEFNKAVTGGDLGLSAFTEANDICTDVNGNAYIMDTNNGRVIVLNPDLTLKTVLSDFTYNGEALDIKGALGLFVNTDGKIYIADTKNARIVVCNIAGEVISAPITLPDADVIPEDFQYMPKRIAMDSKGYMYVVSEGSYYGTILYDPNGNFVSFYGANTVTSTLSDIIGRAFELLFSNDTKAAEAVRTLPYMFTDLAVDNHDFIYTVTGFTNVYKADPGQLKKLSPGGINVLKDKTAIEVKSSDTLQFSDANKSTRSVTSEYRVTNINSLTVSEKGYMYASDATYGRIYIYDQNCNPIAVFGGGTGAASQDGMSSIISSLALGTGDTVIALDRQNGAVQSYSLTDYGKLLLEAQQYTVEGAYIEAKPLWDEVIKYDRNCQLAYRGLAKAALIEEDYDLAVEYAKIGIDQDAYASAFEFVRADYLTKNFTWIFLIAVVAVGALAYLLYITNKREVKLVKNRQVSIMFQSIVHPFQTFTKIRYEGEGSVGLATIVLVVFYIANFVSQVYGGFMYQIFDKTTFNSLIVLLGTVGLVLLWVICNWGMSTLFEGKGGIKHIYICTCYSLIPITAYQFIYTALSNFVLPDEALIITAINYVCLALTGIMFCVSIMTVHEFGFGKFVGITAITVVAMLVVVFIMFMIGILVQQFGTFFVTIYNEVKYR